MVDVVGFNLEILVTSMIQANFGPYSTSFILMSRTLRKVLVLQDNPTSISPSIGLGSGRLISRDNRCIQVLISRNEEKLVHIPEGA
jgi:hypothetical protein